MKIQEYKIKSQNVVHIYLTEQEKEDIKTKEKIEQIKAGNNNVALFVSGDDDPEKILKEMVKIMKSNVITNY